MYINSTNFEGRANLLAYSLIVVITLQYNSCLLITIIFSPSTASILHGFLLAISFSAGPTFDVISEVKSQYTYLKLIVSAKRHSNEVERANKAFKGHFKSAQHFRFDRIYQNISPL